jgi:ATP-binding cassette subfamily B protein
MSLSPPPKPPQTFSVFFWQMLRPYRRPLALITLTFIIYPLLEMLFPLLLRETIDVLQEHGTDKLAALTALKPLGLMLVGMLLMNEICFRSYDWISMKTKPTLRRHIIKAAVEYTQHHSTRYFAENFAGSIANKTRNLSFSILEMLNIWTEIFLPTLVGAVFACILIWQIEPSFALLLGGWFFLHIYGTYFFTKKCTVYAIAHSDALTTLQGKLVDMFTNILTVQLFARSRYEKAYLGRYLNNECRKNKILYHYFFGVKFLLGALGSLMFLVWCGVAIYFWYYDRITVGELAQLVMTLNTLMMMAWHMGLNFSRYFAEKGVAQEAFTLLSQPHELTDSPTALPLNVTQGTIRFDTVTFQYGTRAPLFKNKTVEIAAGQKVGLVGFSGSGKTTFINLILRQYDVTSGRILIDEQDIAQVTRESLHAQIAVIPQDTTLFHRSLLENIRYGNPAASPEQVIAAAQQAHCHVFIRAIPEGYAALVGERGVKLSGGQRQRIAIARAILKNAPILILDEATSALDSITEQKIQHSLQQLMEHRTTIVVAHRLSTLLTMDRILVFDNGQIIEDGAHATLLAQEGHYARLWAKQSSGFLPETPDDNSAK